MRRLRIPALVGGLTLTAAVALASPGGSPEPPSNPPPSSNPAIPSSSSNPSTPVSAARAEAEQSYSLAYDEIAKAKKDLEAGKDKNAHKKFKKALERVENAVSLDASYHEAWNLLGYSARKLGDYDKAFKAYDKCLELKPDYAPAREYLGEAWLEKGDAGKAREQLTMLDRFSPESEEGKLLRSAIETYAAAHPDGVKAEAVPAVPDTVSTSENNKDKK